MKHKLSFSIFVYSFILIFVTLGVWQLYRLEWKLNLISEINNAISSEPIQFNSNNIKNFQKVRFKGKIDNDKILYLYSLNEEGEPGFDIINPINIENKLISLNETVKIKNKILKNCLKIEGFGQTSFFPGAPLGKIDITIKKTEWYAPGLGLVKLIREEISDSETMGNIYYEKVMNFD